MPILINPWKYSYIRKLAEEATFLAQQEGLRPVTAAEVTRTYKLHRRLNIPNLGEYVPDGWTRIDPLVEPVLVGKTGRTQPGESEALTAAQFAARAEQHTKGESSFVVGYGVIEVSQTLALVAAYRRDV